MNILSPVRRITSFVCLIAGIVMFVASLYMDIFKVKNDARGTLLVVGAILIIAGLYFFPTLKHHRTIINILFLFPLLFTFAVTVIIPLLLGIYYSFTDWNGIKMTEFVGFANYINVWSNDAFKLAGMNTLKFSFMAVPSSTPETAADSAFFPVRPVVF